MISVLVIMLAGCGGGGGGSENVVNAPANAVKGAGIKGPLAHAIVRLYQVDLTSPDLKGSLLDEGVTGSDAAINDLTIDNGLSGLVLLEFVADAATTDIGTGMAPVIERLTTVVDVQRIYNGDAIYATPLTSMAVSLAQANAYKGAPYAGNSDGPISTGEFTAALAVAQNQIKSTLGFGLDSSVDIFSVPPILTADTTTAEAQAQVVKYRAAIEAIAALADQVASDSSAADTPQEIFDGLTEDLKDGTIDGLNDSTPVTTLAALDTPIDTTLGSLDPATLVIPNTSTPITDIKQALSDELATTGEAVDTTPLAAIEVNPAPPVLVAESRDTYSIGGTLAGLNGSVVLQNNAGDDLTLNSNGAFSFATPVADGDGYSVTVRTQPSGQTCTASSNSGTVSGANVTTVTVTCATHTFSIGGTLSGLPYLKTVTLQLNGGNNLVLNNDGPFQFATPIADGGSYNVTVSYASAGLDCLAANNTGTVNGDKVRDVAITCTTQTHTVGGSVTGLSGSLVLQNNGGDDLTINAGDNSFTFNTAVTYGRPYSVSVLTQPTGQTCAVSNGIGSIDITDVTNVSVTCTTNSYTVGGAVSGLSGSVVLQNNGGDNLTINADRQYVFVTPIIHGGSYSVSVLTQPAGQTCVASNSTGTVNGAKVTNVAITCTDHSYTVGGNVSGLSGSVVLQNNGGDDLTLIADGDFTFNTAIINGGSYNVTVLTQPAGQTCTASANTGSVNAANVSNVVVTCSANSYTIGGTVSGLSGSVVLQNNGGDDLTLDANRAFTFTTPIADGGSYNVSVLSQPAGQICTVSSNSGSVSGANVSTVSVSCVSAYSIGGTVSGLSGSVVLQNNGGDDLTVNADGAFSFNTPVADTGNYSVAVSTQPANLTCFVGSPSGQVSGADITNIFVFCSSPELDADVISDTVTLDWMDVGASSYNLYYSSESNCDIANYASCADGTLLTNVTPPLTVTDLAVEQNWWFQLESVVTGANGVAQVGVRTSQVSPQGTLTGIQNLDHGFLNAITHDSSGRTYLGGDFAAMANVSGRGVVASAARADGTATGHARAYPVIGGGNVYAAASDGNGGYYIGGNFTEVDGQPHSGLAHVLPSGELDPYWTPQADNTVYSIAVAGSTVYVGGDFLNIDGLSHARLAAIDTDGNLQSWDPGLDGGVRAMQLSGTTLYIGGGFGSVGGNARGKLAAIDTTTGNLTSWTPATVNDGEVRGLVVYNGSVYFGGTFTQVDGATHKYLAAVDSNGALTTWDPAPDQKVYSLAISGSTIYAGGYFSAIGGGTHYYLAAIDATNGTVQNWPTGYSLSVAGSVRSLAVHGSTVYVGGDLSGFNGTEQKFAAAYGTDGSFYNWDVAVDDHVYALAADDDTVFVGGTFNLQGGVARSNLAALEADDSLDLNWAPAADDVVEVLAVSGSTLYAGGQFTSIDDGSGAQTRNRLAAIGTTDGVLDANWAPLANGAVHTLAVDGSGTVYAGGAFTNIDDGTSYPRSYLAAIDSSGYVVSSWVADADAEVFGLSVSGSTVYVGGNFYTINGTTRKNLAAMGTDGNLDPWSPLATAYYFQGMEAVSDILVSGSTIYIAGAFVAINDGSGNGNVSIGALAAIGTNGLLASWEPAPYGEVYSIALSGTTLYAAGQFSAIGATPRNYAAGINTGDGTATSLDPDLDNWSFAVDAHNGKVYFGGEFTTQGGMPSPLLTILPE
jgi:hypothetical protein